MDCETEITAGFDGIITAVSGSSERLFGYAADELVGQPIDIIIANDYCGRHSAGMDAVRGGKPLSEGTISGRGRRKDGSEVPVLVTLAMPNASTIRATITKILVMELT